MKSAKLPQSQDSSHVQIGKLLELLATSDKMLEGVFHRNRQSTLNAVVQGVHDLLNAEGCAIFLVEEGAPDHLVLAASCTDRWGLKKKDNVRLLIRSTHGGGLTGHVGAHARFLNLWGKRYYNNPYRKRIFQKHLEGGRGYSYMGIPLKDRKRQLIGVVTVDNKKGSSGRPDERTAFNKADGVIARILSTQIPLVLESLRRFELFSGLMEEMQNARDRSKMLHAILNRAILLLHGERGDFALFEPSKNDLIIAAVEGKRTARTLSIGMPMPDPSLMRRVWNSKGPGYALVPDVRRLKTHYYESHSATRSEVVVRFEADGKPIGVLNVESSRLRAFDQQDVEILIMLARYASFAVQFAEEETRLWTLMERVLDYSQPSEATLASLLESVREIYGFDAGLIYVADYQAHLLRCRTWMGCEHLKCKPETFSYRFQDKSLATQIFRGVRGFTEGYFSRNPKRDHRINQRGRRRFDIRSPIVGVPLRFGDRVVGVLVVWSRQSRPPTRAHLEHLKPLAKLAACKIAIWESERQRAQSEELYRSLVETLPQCIFRKDKEEKRFTFANRAFCELLKRTPSEIIGRTDFDFYPPELARKYRGVDQRVIDTGKPVEMEEHNPGSGKEDIWVGVTKIPIKDREGNITGVQAIFWDISDRKVRETLQERWRRLIEVLPDAVLAGGDGKINLINQSAVDLLGASDQREILGRPLTDFIPNEMRARMARSIKRLLRTRRSHGIAEGQFRRLDGKDVTVEIAGCTVVGAQGKEQLLVAHDISSRKRQQKQLEEANAEKAVLLKEIHHRVTNNLTSAIAVVQMQAPGISDPVAREALSETEDRIQAIAVLHRIICQSGEFTRVNAHDYITKLIESLFKSHLDRPGSKRPQLRVKNIHFDPETAMSCGRIVHEFVSNSLKHGFPNRPVGIIRIALSRSHKVITLTVRDNGDGLPRDFSLKDAHSVGLRLVRVLAMGHLKGDFQITRKSGFTISKVRFADRDRTKKEMTT
jgi:PAS domain S-box-containing protein